MLCYCPGKFSFVVILCYYPGLLPFVVILYLVTSASLLSRSSSNILSLSSDLVFALHILNKVKHGNHDDNDGDSVDVVIDDIGSHNADGDVDDGDDFDNGIDVDIGKHLRLSSSLSRSCLVSCFSTYFFSKKIMM